MVEGHEETGAPRALHVPGAPARRWRRRLAVVAAALLLLVALLPASLWWLGETESGRAVVAAQLSRHSLRSGLRLQVARIDGSLWSRFELVGARLHDLDDGPLAEAPLLRVRWSPLELLRGGVDVEEIDIPSLRLLRKPHVRPADPDEPLLPDLDIRVARFDVPHLLLEEAVAGRAETLVARGSADLRAGRLLLDAKVRSTGADRLAVLLDAEPDRDRFDLAADLLAPADGVFAALVGLRQQLEMKVEGDGSWRRWRGQLRADLGGGEEGGEGRLRVAELAIMADDGRWRLGGDFRPAPFLAEALQPLFRPSLKLDATARRDDKGFDVRFLASSAAVSATGHVRTDLALGRIAEANAELLLRDARAAHPALAAEGLTTTLAAEGALRAPDIRWTATARRLLVDRSDGQAIGVAGVAAAGRLLLPKDDAPLQLPFEVRAGTILGLPQQLAPLLGAPRLSGTLSYASGTVRAGLLLLRTAALEARGDAAIGADGRGSANLAASARSVAVPGVGEATGSLGMRLTRSAAGRFGGGGRIEARLLQLASPGVEKFLGGLPEMSAALTVDAAGRLLVGDGRLHSPNLEVRAASGSYDPGSGRLSFEADGASAAYGPFALAASGTPQAPQASLHMPAPGFGLRDLELDLAPAGTGLQLTVRGESSNGPLDGQMLLLFADGQPLTIGVDRLAFAGIEAQGAVQQTEAGPFAGRLQVDGRGTSTALTLLDEGGLQRIDIDARALNARLPLGTPIGLARGEALFTLVLGGEHRQLKGAFRLQGVNRAGMVLTDVQGAANLAEAKGVATLQATGRSGDGQALAWQARVQSVADGYAISLDGNVGRQPLRLVRPAHLLREADGYRLQPAEIRLPQGAVVVAGSWGELKELRLDLREVDLAILDTVRAGLGFGGRASGQMVVRSRRRSVLPEGDANLVVSGLERAGVTGLTVPVDMRLSAHSDDGGLKLGARISWQDNELGRLVVEVDPGEGETPTERFFSGRLSGGIRYNGPVEPLFALVGSEGQELQGPVAIAANFGGTPASPNLSGVARATGLVYRNASYGTEIADLGFNGRFTDDSLQLSGLQARAGAGSLSGRGFVRFGDRPVVNLEVDLDKAQLASNDLLEFTLSGPVRVAGRGREATLSGDLSIDSARVQLVQVASGEVAELKVRRAGVVVAPSSDSALSARNLGLDVRIRADDRVRVEGMGLDSMWSGDIRVRGTAQQPEFSGIATLQQGEFQFAGSDFDLTSGRVVMNGDPLDSSLDIRAQTQATDVTAIIDIAGTAARPEIRFSSTPTLPEDEILSRLLFGSSVADLSVTEAVQLATAVAGLQSGVDTMGKLRRAVGVDRLRLVSDSGNGTTADGNGVGTGIAIGKRLTRNLYVEVLTGSQGNTLTTLQLTLSRIWSLFIDVSSIGTGSANLRYQRES